MKKGYAVVMLFLLCPAFLYAGDTLSVMQRNLRNNSFGETFFDLLYRNPAEKYYQHALTLTEVNAIVEYSDEDQPIFLQKGDGLICGSFDVDSYIALKNRKLWGQAYYRNGVKRDVVWNETSDYDWVYPYVLGDSVGGDLRCEEYYFAGGYAREYGRVTWGGTLDYRAAVEFRNIDPRPKNVVGELTASLGISLRTKTHYGIGISAFATKYKQSNEIKFYSELGQSKVYHFTGMGMDYARFSGNNNSAYYKGKSFGGNIGISSHEQSGFSGTFSYRYYSCEKIISSLNELPMALIHEHSGKFEIGYRNATTYRVWGVKGYGNVSCRNGIENLFGDAANEIYPKIGEVEQYHNNIFYSGIVGMYEAEIAKGYKLSLSPEVTYRRNKTSYIYPSRSLEENRLSGNVSVRGYKTWENCFLQIDAGVGYSRAFNTDIALSETEITDSGVLNMLYHNYRFISSNSIFSDIGIQFSHRILKNYLLQIKAAWKHGCYMSKVKSDYISGAIGISF